MDCPVLLFASTVLLIAEATTGREAGGALSEPPPGTVTAGVLAAVPISERAGRVFTDSVLEPLTVFILSLLRAAEPTALAVADIAGLILSVKGISALAVGTEEMLAFALASDVVVSLVLPPDFISVIGFDVTDTGAFEVSVECLDEADEAAAEGMDETDEAAAEDPAETDESADGLVIVDKAGSFAVCAALFPWEDLSLSGNGLPAGGFAADLPKDSAVDLPLVPVPYESATVAPRVTPASTPDVIAEAVVESLRDNKNRPRNNRDARGQYGHSGQYEFKKYNA